MTEGPFLADAPPDTDRYIYRPVTTFRGDAGEGIPAVFTEIQQIWIAQP
jgi:hypothetical protein